MSWTGCSTTIPILRPKEHFVDQHGFTDQLFGLCHLLGFSLMPRLNVSKQTLYKLDRTKSYGRLDEVIRARWIRRSSVNSGINWCGVAASLRNRTAPAHVVLRRLASSAPSDRLAKALTALGRALRSLYLLRYIHEEDLRGRMQLQVNRGEGTAPARPPPLFRQPRGVSDRRLRRDHEQSDVSESAVQRGGGVEYRADVADHRAAARQR